VKVGDKVSQGVALLTLDDASDAQPSPTTQALRTPAVSSAPSPSPAGGRGGVAAASPQPLAIGSGSSSAPHAGEAAGVSGHADIECQMLVLGSGPGGYSAAFRAADLGMKTVLVERFATLGGVCLNVGCIPSKALLHTAFVMDEVKTMAAHGIRYGEPALDLEALRKFKNDVVKKLTSGLAGMAKARKVEVVRGVGRFVDPHRLEVTLTQGAGREASGQTKTIRFEKAIVAAGSEAVKLPFMPEDPRIVDSTGALELPLVPKRMLVVGGGIIGLEMANVYSSLGARIDVVEMLDGVMLGADRDLVKVWQKVNVPRFDRVMLNTKTVAAEARKDGIRVTFEGANAPADAQTYDLVLVAVGRRPNGKAIGADHAGVNVSDRGYVEVDAQMRTNVAHVFAIGDIAGAPMLAHKAVHEGHVAAEAASGMKSYFDARQIPSVAYTDPEVAWTGVTEDECKAKGIAYGKAVFPWAASGRAIANGRDEGFTKLLFDEATHRIIGGGIVGTHAGDLISEIGLAIEMGADAVDIGKTIHPHPTLSESIGMAAEVYEGVCTDLPPPRKK
jgi:dihydrolipoamide dehydrogenase